MEMKSIGVLTSGGDSPGMNAAVRAVVKTGINCGLKVYGIYNGYEGLLNNQIRELRFEDVNQVVSQGGTFLGSSRSPRFHNLEDRQIAYENLRKYDIDGLVLIGGDGTFKGAQCVAQESGISVIGLPGTIDNDIFGTDFTIGFDTAFNTAVEAIDKLRDTSSSHNRVFFVELMGRDAGFLALYAGIAGGAEDILIPEEITNIEDIAKNINHIYKGTRGAIIVVAEGDDAGGAIDVMNKMKELCPNKEMRAVILGHVQRGGRPSAFDRLLATRLGVASVESLLNGQSGIMVGVCGGELSYTSLDLSIKKHAEPSQELIQLPYKVYSR